MLNKRFNFLLVGGIILMAAISFVSVLKITDKVFAAPQSGHSLKLFVQGQETLESSVNNWLSAQTDIAVDSFSLVDYNGGDYLVVIGYHSGGTGSLATRLKLIAGENSEADAQAFLSSLGESGVARFISATPGYYSKPNTTITVPIIFIVYE